jgi:hypothetical protein
MSFARRAALLTVGLALGVGSAPYVCTPTAELTLPSERGAFVLGFLRRTNRSYNTCSSSQYRVASSVSSSSVEAELVHSSTADDALVTVVDRVLRLIDGAAQLRAAIFGSAHQTASAASAASTDVAISGNEAASAGEADTTECEAAVGTTALREVPHQLKGRFLHYAQRDPKSGEFVLTLEGFVRCMLLLPETEAAVSTTARPPLSNAASHDPAMADDEMSHTLPSSSSSSWLQRLPPAVRRRFIHFFRCVDLDGTNAIDYAEFVVLFTLLSTQRQTLERAFHVFDLDDNGRVSEREFCRLLNTIMVDPAVQVTYNPAGGRGEGEGPDGSRSPPHDAPSVSTASRAGVSRRSVRQRQKYKNDLSFELSSDLMRPLLFGPLPLHVGAPPGSTHYRDVSTEPASGAAALTKERSTGGGGSDTVSGNATVAGANPAKDRSGTVSSCNGNATAAADVALAPSKSVTWWTSVGRRVQHAWLQLGSATSTSAFDVAPPSRLADLQRMAAQDTLLEAVSYPTFLYRMDYLRWELRAIEFGLCDPSNSGFISVEDCRRLLRRDHRAIMSRNNKATKNAKTPANTAATDASRDAALSSPVTWQVYQKLFDVIKESSTILPALELMLDALPPVPADVLSGGAIPDAELPMATLAVKAVVQQTVLSYNKQQEVERKETSASGSNNTKRGQVEAASSAVAAVSNNDEGDRGTTGRQREGDGLWTDLAGEPVTQARYNEERFGLAADAAQSPEAAQMNARRLQATLVRPTALTWQQFSQALTAVSTVPRLTAAEEAIFRALLDEDGSNSLSPQEFAQLCAMKESFFAEHLPRFDEPQRNAIQQFFFCMQQLD